MLKKFLRNQDGNYATLFAIGMVPMFLSVGIAVDHSNISRLKYNLGDSTDAAAGSVAKLFVAGSKTDDELRAHGAQFFASNFDPDYLSSTVVTVTLPTDPGNTSKELKVQAKLTYKPIFAKLVAHLMKTDANYYSTVIEEATMKMKNVAEIALVLDNSGSMSRDKFNNSGAALANQRITLLKNASKQLITTMIDLGEKIHQVSDPVKFSLVPFSASVNVGATNSTQPWMDTLGASPIHHEHLDWGTPSTTNPTGYRTAGTGHIKLDASGNPLTRFSIYNALQFRSGGTESTTQCEVWRQGATATDVTNQCAVRRRTGTLTNVGASSTAAATAIASGTYNLDWLREQYAWKGCVEMRPNGLDVTDTTAASSNPSSLFVPMFAPDDFNTAQYGTGTGSTSIYGGYNNWWPDFETDADFRAGTFWPTYNDSGQPLSGTFAPTSSAWWTSTSRPRMTNVAKYFANRPYLSGQNAPSSTSGRRGQWQYFRDKEGPNESCTTDAITALTGNETNLHAAIDRMSPTGNTNVPEGMAWGWRTVSSKAPFTEGVSETRKDIDKVVIVLTDGANTYGDITQQNAGDVSGTQSTYAAWGYSGYAGNAGTNGIATVSNGSNVARIFLNTSASKTTHDSTNFQKAMDQKMATLCQNIKNEDIILMTVALDIDPARLSGSAATAAQKALDELKACAGNSKVKKDASGNPEKLFWNATSDTLDDTFKEIADELSNLRFTG